MTGHCKCCAIVAVRLLFQLSQNMAKNISNHELQIIIIINLCVCHTLFLTFLSISIASISSAFLFKYHTEIRNKKYIVSPRQRAEATRFGMSERAVSKLNHHHLFKSNAIWCVKHAHIFHNDELERKKS